ncbi:hypothetical protein DFH08DRAFT_816316 [Mycena albidolilacea]|uniref:Uncharacterized protein n=1 Tax=Mycena albidolilacea TaxID=1033008 RepID=A0AAD6ZKP4_9AGAR|nr:hypothetical protein DFH08DRAFT_816316 [Mycena albidolilacea]
MPTPAKKLVRAGATPIFFVLMLPRRIPCCSGRGVVDAVLDSVPLPPLLSYVSHCRVWMAIMKMIRTRKLVRGKGEGGREALAPPALCANFLPVYYESEGGRRAADIRAGTACAHKWEGTPTPNLRKVGEVEVVTSLVTASASPLARPRLSVALYVYLELGGGTGAGNRKWDKRKLKRNHLVSTSICVLNEREEGEEEPEMSGEEGMPEQKLESADVRDE